MEVLEPRPEVRLEGNRGWISMRVCCRIRRGACWRDRRRGASVEVCGILESGIGFPGLRYAGHMSGVVYSTLDTRFKPLFAAVECRWSILAKGLGNARKAGMHVMDASKTYPHTKKSLLLQPVACTGVKREHL